jgi:hypothetical protein
MQLGFQILVQRLDYHLNELEQLPGFPLPDLAIDRGGHRLRRSAIEPVIGHIKAEGHLGRCRGPPRPLLSQRPCRRRRQCHPLRVGYNFRRILAWLRALLRLILIAIGRLLISRSTLIPVS